MHSSGLDITDASKWLGWFLMLHSDAEVALIPAGLLTGISSFPSTGKTPLPA